MTNNSEIHDLHEPLKRWLRQEKILYRYSNPSKRTSETPGEPDFLLMLNGRVLPIEFKLDKGRLSTKQVFRHAEYAAAGCKVRVVRSYEVALELINAWRSNDLPDKPGQDPAKLRQHMGWVWQSDPNNPTNPFAFSRARKCGSADAHLPQLFPVTH